MKEKIRKKEGQCFSFHQFPCTTFTSEAFSTTYFAEDLILSKISSDCVPFEEDGVDIDDDVAIFPIKRNKDAGGKRCGLGIV